MRTLGFASLALLALVGCEHTNGKNEQKNEPQPSAPARSAETPTNPPPANAQVAAPPSGEVRPPVAEDLPGYLKQITGDGTLVATIETSMGPIHCELFEKQSPMTVANFVGLATGQKPWTNPKTRETETNKPYFEGLTFHRVIKEFMIQGGDPLGVGQGGPGYQFGSEFPADLKMQAGTLAMANAGLETNGSQFFITEVATDNLNGKHTIFGQCKELDVVKAIARAPQGAGNKPDKDITMNVKISRMKSW